MLLLGAVFSAIGVVQPFLPAFLADRGLSPGEISLALAVGAGVRLVAGPLAGRWADALRDPRHLMMGAALAAGLAAAGFAGAKGLLGFVLMQVVLNAAMAPLTPLADTLTLAAARRGLFDYGPVRAAGSVSFILMAAFSGWAVGAWGLVAVPWLLLLTLLATLWAIWALPPAPRAPKAAGRGGFLTVLRLPGFLRLLLLSGLIQSSHAAYYAFGSIHWGAAGHSPFTIGLLWAEGVVGEVALFLFGRPLLERLGARGMALLAAGAGLLRWLVMAETVWLPALLLTQLLHALSFGAQHLAAMHLILRLVPPQMAGTAQSLHSALGVGLLMGAATYLSGPGYAALGGGVFLLMAGLCALALPLALTLRR